MMKDRYDLAAWSKSYIQWYAHERSAEYSDDVGENCCSFSLIRMAEDNKTTTELIKAENLRDEISFDEAT